jgi:hypothetical protein
MNTISRHCAKEPADGDGLLNHLKAKNVGTENCPGGGVTYIRRCPPRERTLHTYVKVV